MCRGYRSRPSCASYLTFARLGHTRRLSCRLVATCSNICQSYEDRIRPYRLVCHQWIHAYRLCENRKCDKRRRCYYCCRSFPLTLHCIAHNIRRRHRLALKGSYFPLHMFYCIWHVIQNIHERVPYFAFFILFCLIK